jgi:hypothetical protein
MADAGFPFFGELARQTSDDAANQFDVDQIFERAVAWAAGGGTPAQATTSFDTTSIVDDYTATDTLAFATPPVDATLI